MSLTQKKTVLDYVGHDTDAALYMVPIDEDTEAMPLRVLIPIATYDDLGRQRKLTVTIQPGDELNDADAAFQADAGV